MTLQSRAAICSGPEAPFEIAPVALDALRPDELRVRIVACGICHTDLAVRDRQLPVPVPVVLGHEGAGIVEAVGADVTAAKVGDRVVMSFNSCGHCPSCADHAPTYCYDFFPENWSGTRADGSPTLFRDGEPLNGNFFGQSSFATHAIAHQRNVVKVPETMDDVPLDILAPIGCGLMTGAGAVLRSMQVRAGLPLAVWGAGTVGMAAIMAARIAGAGPIIAIDLHDSRLDLARELGATHTINGREDVAAKIRELCPAGLGYAFDTTGVNRLIEGAFNLLAPKGVIGLVGASAPDAELTFNESALMGGGRRVMGILGGDSDIVTFLPELMEHYRAGRFPFDRLIGHFAFEDINAAIAASESGAVIKPVLRISPEG
ncbi:NAD(P)-dependent alcohol dehydrogenase [Novosphingobium sp. 1949]|uniref:NAD(P)-dependent alcohol dehydrogenase n=1 Tax=Novosphingobium organovorum TaxID=2930092 RepID=A0ABT0B9M8_9SPHN|nr:NAD(P)-dependent alcohol dehydrogenase [Novosphingobium organovorum]MCJ2181782.1 NAD(P)-dependent alcohol dehydrogenase [Novosphingobium organovorum]